LSQREAQLAEHLAKVDSDLRALEHERRLVKREREALGDADSRARVREESLRQREETFRLRLNERLDERLRDARAEIDAIVADLKKQAAALAEQASHAVASPSTGDVGRLRVDARTAVDTLVEKYRTDPVPAAPVAEAPPMRHVVVGDRVVLGSFGLEGVVVNVHDREGGSGSARQAFSLAHERAPRGRRRTGKARARLSARQRAAAAARGRVVERIAARGQHRRSGSRPARKISRRESAFRTADIAVDSRVWHRAG
jgi:hypothetical protein